MLVGPSVSVSDHLDALKRRVETISRSGSLHWKLLAGLVPDAPDEAWGARQDGDTRGRLRTIATAVMRFLCYGLVFGVGFGFISMFVSVSIYVSMSIYVCVYGPLAERLNRLVLEELAPAVKLTK